MAIFKHGFDGGTAGAAVTSTGRDETSADYRTRPGGEVGWSYSGDWLDSNGRPRNPIRLPLMVARGWPTTDGDYRPDTRLMRTNDGRWSLTLRPNGDLHCTGCDQIIQTIEPDKWSLVEHICPGRHVPVPEPLDWRWGPGVRP